MTFDEWWDTAPSAATPDTYKGWKESCRQAFESGSAEAKRRYEAEIVDLKKKKRLVQSAYQRAVQR